MENSAPGNSSATPLRRKRAPAIELAELDMRIARDGTWFYRGSAITRPALVKLFASVLRREGESYWLVTPVERGRIIVEDTPFVAVAVEREGAGCNQRLIFRTNLDEIVAAGPEHPLRVETTADGTPSPYVLVRPGLEARIRRPVFYELVEWADEQRDAGAGRFGLWSEGVFFELGDPGEED